MKARRQLHSNNFNFLLLLENFIITALEYNAILNFKNNLYTFFAFLTDVKSVVPVIQHEFAQPLGTPRLPIKSQPWTPIRSFLLERELSFHPDKVFVRQLIDDLQHGCSIGYTGPQFAHQANNLLSAHQQTTVIDATFQKECAVGRILGSFQTPPLPNFRTSVLGLVPKHDGGWRIIYHLTDPAGHSINDFIDPFTYIFTFILFN